MDAFGLQIINNLKFASRIKRNVVFFCQCEEIFYVARSKPQCSIGGNRPDIGESQDQVGRMDRKTYGN